MPSGELITFVGGLLQEPVPEGFTLPANAKSALASIQASGDEYSIPEYTPISNQLQAGTCVANAWCDALEMLLGIEQRQAGIPNPTPTQLSRLFLYWTARCTTGTQKEDKGTYIHAAGKQLQVLGVCQEDLWPYRLSNLFTSPTLEAFNTASDNQVVGLFSLTDTDTRLDDVETCVRADHPVIFATGVGPEYSAYTGGGNAFDPPSSVLGGHAQIIVGIRRRLSGQREYKVRNSWSERWGNDGHAWISESYLSWVRTTDLWFATRMKELTI